MNLGSLVLRRHGPWLLAVALALGVAASRHWIADDAYISFRYARHLVEGHGLVFNPGERVEGFTNLAWTLWIALGLALGAGAEPWASAWSLLAYAGVIALLARWPTGPAPQPPVAAFGVAACAPCWSFATGGLETMAFTLLVLGSLRLQLRAELCAGVRGAFAAGACAGLAAATRPEGLLLGALLLGASARRGLPGRRGPRLASTALGLGALVLPVFLFRGLYYGALLPNTAYAKSAELSWYAQGFAYAGYFFREHWVLLLGPLAVCAAALAPARRARLLPGSGRAVLAALLLAWPVLQVGGDFMHARMWVPIVPLLWLTLQAGAFALWPAAAGRPALALCAAVLGSLARLPADPQAMWERGIVDERTFVDPVRERPARAATFARYFEGLDVRVAFTGGDARLMYEARIPVALESETGLTDAFVARQPLISRGRIGHEKPAPLEYLVRERGAHFTLRTRGLALLLAADKIPLVEVRLDDERAFCLRWDPALMARLSERGARFQDFPASLDRTLLELPGLDDAEVRRRYAQLELFYFAHVADPARERPFLDRLARARATRVQTSP